MMMPATTEMVTVEVWVKIGADGQYAAHTDPDELLQRYEDECDGSQLATRVIKITIQVPTPAPLELTATIAAEPATGELAVTV
jgi:hypothetical protein